MHLWNEVKRLDYTITKNTNKTPRAFLTTIEGEEVEAVTLADGKTYYLSISYGLQEKGYKRVDLCKVAYIIYDGREKLVGLFDIVKED